MRARYLLDRLETRREHADDGVKEAVERQWRADHISGAGVALSPQPIREERDAIV